MQCLNFEGGDKVGKHTAVIAATRLLLLSGYDVILMDLPQYWYSGILVHKLLRQKDIEVSDPAREIELRCVFYAFDRICTLINLIPVLEQNPPSIIISDRGCKSLIVSVAFALTQNKIKESDVHYFVEKFNYWDSEYIKLLDPKPILLTTGEGGKSAHERGIHEREDYFEQSDVQVETHRLYTEVLNLPQIYTQKNSEWRGTLEIARDVLDQEKIKYDDKITQEEINNLTGFSLLDNPNITIIGPHLVYKQLYGKEWSGVEAKFSDLFDKWEVAMLDGDKPTLKTLEPEIANIFMTNLPKEIYVNVPESIKTWYKKILREYPEVENLISELASKEYLNYVNKFFA